MKEHAFELIAVNRRADIRIFDRRRRRAFGRIGNLITAQDADRIAGKAVPGSGRIDLTALAAADEL